MSGPKTKLTRIRLKKLKYLIHNPKVTLFKIGGKSNLANVLTRLVTMERFDILREILLGKDRMEQVNQTLYLWSEDRVG